jgi:UDP-N-acetylmuramyl pentapeptide phosphotransferase/UDP-N-acetylglucosamine-1-phosphate transferase
MAVLYAVLVLELPGWSFWPARLAWVVLGCVLAVAATGWSEDLAARRRPTWWPRLSPRPS